MYEPSLQNRLPAACIEARHAKAALDTAPNKTGANGADGLSRERRRLMMTAPGAGVLTALSCTSMIEDPVNFKNARAVGAFAGLTGRSYQSGGIDYDGHISKRGGKRVRAALRSGDIGATRIRSESALRRWGLKLKDRAGVKRAAVAVARNLGVIMRAMWRDGSTFDPMIMAA